MLCPAGYYAPLVTAVVFVGASITDAVDGYLARKVGLAKELPSSAV